MTEIKPIRRSSLPGGRYAEYQEASVMGGEHGMLLWPGPRPGRVVVRRKVEYGDWEPVSPPYWAPEAELESSGNTVEDRLSAVRRIAHLLNDSADVHVWRIAHAINRLCMGTITVAQAIAELED